MFRLILYTSVSHGHIPVHFLSFSRIYIYIHRLMFHMQVAFFMFYLFICLNVYSYFSLFTILLFSPRWRVYILKDVQENMVWKACCFSLGLIPCSKGQVETLLTAFVICWSLLVFSYGVIVAKVFFSRLLFRRSSIAWLLANTFTHYSYLTVCACTVQQKCWWRPKTIQDVDWVPLRQTFIKKRFSQNQIKWASHLMSPVTGKGL